MDIELSGEQIRVILRALDIADIELGNALHNLEENFIANALIHNEITEVIKVKTQLEELLKEG